MDENEPIQKLKKAEAELAEMKNNLDEKNKLCLSQKHQIEDFTIEVKNLNDKLKNQENLIKFYQEKSEQEDNDTETDPEKLNADLINEYFELLDILAALRYTKTEDIKDFYQDIVIESFNSVVKMVKKYKVSSKNLKKN